MRAACPTDVPMTMVDRMEAMEKRLDAMSQAMKTVRPALEAFYATLSDEQKAQLNSDRGTPNDAQVLPPHASTQGYQYVGEHFVNFLDGARERSVGDPRRRNFG